MIEFLRAHGFDPGPLQRPLLAGAVTGFAASLPALGVLIIFPSFKVVAHQVMGLSNVLSALVLIGSFTLSGLIYALVFRRAANDKRGGWLFGAGFGFLLWMAAPLVVLPFFSGSVMAAGLAATGLFACFVVWGTVAGWLFPFIHHPLQRQLSSEPDVGWSLGPGAAALREGAMRQLRGVVGRG
ncbi:MAG TPA: hypothetical protein VKA79_15555 [Aestuariivirgaceae bacterium]|nr:hypothetical protein [Aestuariivirgaceae bacterium]